MVLLCSFLSVGRLNPFVLLDTVLAIHCLSYFSIELKDCAVIKIMSVFPALLLGERLSCRASRGRQNFRVNGRMEGQ